MDSKKQRIELLAPKVAAGVSIALAIFKVGAGIRLSSTALMASGFDSVFDAVASSIGFFFLKLSHQPADKDHPYGHSRIAAVTSLAQAVLLLGLAFVLAESAARKIHEPFNINSSMEFLNVAIIANIVTALLCIYLTIVVNKTKSLLVSADRLHYLSDLGANILLLVGFFIGPYFLKYNMDSILTFVLCAFIVVGAYKIIMDSINNLVDHNDPEVEEHIRKIIEEFFPKVLGVGRIRSRKAGYKTAVDLELISCRLQTFKEVHKQVHEVEIGVHQRIPHVDMIIHAEPCGQGLCLTDAHCKIKN